MNLKYISQSISKITNNRPLLFILLSNFILHTMGFTWGLPNKESWAIDAVVPAGMLQGLLKGFSFGYSWQYPMIHLVILSVLSLPVLIIALINVFVSHSWAAVLLFINNIKGMDAYDIMIRLNELININVYASALMIIARMVTVLMSLCIVYYIYKIGRELFDENTGIFSAIVLTFNLSFTYYSHFENVDVPYLFWAMISFYYFVRIIKYDERWDYILCAIITALSYGTKDQAYAIFVLPFIIYLIIVPLIKQNKSASIFRILFRKNFLIFLVTSIISFIVVENLILNWNGFYKRILDLTGPNSQSYTSYLPDSEGYFALIKDFFRVFLNEAIAIPFAVLAAAGIIILILEFRRNKELFHERLLFLYAIVSFTLVFNFVVLRAEMRFVLPQSVFASFYAGYTIAKISNILKGKFKFVYIIFFLLLCIYGLNYVMSVNMNLMTDVRYYATDWMRKNIPTGSTIERYEGYTYLPQFPDNVKEYRIKKEFSDIENRKPEYIILSSIYYQRFFTKNFKQTDGYKIPIRTIGFQESDQGKLIRDLINGRLNYYEKIRFPHRMKWFRSMIVPDHIIIYERKM